MVPVPSMFTLATAHVPLFVPVFRTPEWRSLRAIVFGLMGSLAFVPMIIGIFVLGIDEMVLRGENVYAVAAILSLACGGFYGVSGAHTNSFRLVEPTTSKFRWPRSGNLEDLIFGAIHTSCFILRDFFGTVVHLWGFLQAFSYQKVVEKC
jgi:adiponectin receptor